MPNPSLKLAMVCASLCVCACVPDSVLTTYHPYNPPGPPTDYSPLMKLSAAPEPFRPGQSVTFTASVFAKPIYVVTSTPQPAILELRAFPGDKDGNLLTGADVATNVIYPGPDTSNWVTVTFPALTIPVAPNPTLKIVVNYRHWFGKIGYIGVGDPEWPRTVLFYLHCGGGDPRASVCVYTRTP